MHDGMPYGRIQGQGQGHSREVDRQSPTGLIFLPTFTAALIVVQFIIPDDLIVSTEMTLPNSSISEHTKLVTSSHSSKLSYLITHFYTPAPNRRGHYVMLLSDVCLSCTSGLSREQRGLARLKLTQA